MTKKARLILLVILGAAFLPVFAVGQSSYERCEFLIQEETEELWDPTPCHEAIQEGFERFNYALGVRYLRSFEHEKARHHFQTALEAAYPAALVGLGHLASTNNKNAARRYYIQYLESTHPQSSMGFFYLSLLEANAENWGKAYMWHFACEQSDSIASDACSRNLPRRIDRISPDKRRVLQETALDWVSKYADRN